MSQAGRRSLAHAWSSPSARLLLAFFLALLLAMIFIFILILFIPGFLVIVIIFLSRLRVISISALSYHHHCLGQYFSNYN